MFYGSVDNKNEGGTVGNQSTSQLQPTTSSPMPTNSLSMYKNGSYSTSVSYRVPSGVYEMGVDLSIQDDIITGVFIKKPAQREENSEVYQSSFEQNINSEAIGKKIQDINLTRIGTSSITTKGFMEAVKKIQDQAKA